MTEPPFSGSIEFKLPLRVFDVGVKRMARADYAYTPCWTYYDVPYFLERPGHFRLNIKLSVLAEPSSDTPGPTNLPTWAPLTQLLIFRVFKTEICGQLLEQIDTAARQLDRVNRIDAEFPAPSQPDQL